MEKTERKQFTYRGKTIDELKQLDVREFAKFLPARARRTVLRQFQEVEKFVNRANKKAGRGKHIKTHSRNLVIVPQLVGMKIQIHSGNGFFPIQVTTEMLGHRLGEFAPTRKKITHGAAGVGATKGSKAQSKT